jgi:septal ring factor EnvC (AmiA/AmiB activator)
MTSEHIDERNAIKSAASRLLAGTPLRSNGALTVVSLAQEADVKRHVLTHRHTDLKDLFYAQVRAQGHVPDSERKLRKDLDTTQRRLAEANEHIKTLENDNDMLARMVNVLATENTQFRDQLQTASSAVVRPLH